MAERVLEHGWVDWDQAGLVVETLRYASAVAELIEAVDDRSSDAVPGLRWTVGELATHVAAVATWYRLYFDGVDDYGYDVSDVTGSNERFMAEYGVRSAAAMAADVRESFAAMVEVAQRSDALRPVGWHAGPRPVAAVLGVGLNELLLHGFDLSRALGRPWRISEDAARHGARAAIVAAPAVVDLPRAARMPMTYRLHVPGMVSADWCFDSTGLRVSQPTRGAGVSCSIRVDSRALLLIAYGRTTALRAALRGRALTWGRRPWAAFGFADYLEVG